ncbi:hypothetical protein OAB09_04520 [Pelagibacteraceae bacterium]|nr:hypothetical protein [Pelagibacteraceae bacterium]
MRIFLTVLILTFSLQSLTKADDIRDFQISGISVGENLIDFFNAEKILRNQKMVTSLYKSDKYSRVHFRDNSKVYDQIGFHFKKDKPYKIGAISGEFILENNIDKCYSKQSDLVNDIQKIFPDKKYVTDKRIFENDPTKKSTSRRKIFYLASGRISVNCVDWSPHMKSKLNWVDHLKVTIETKEFRKWINKEAY